MKQFVKTLIIILCICCLASIEVKGVDEYTTLKTSSGSTLTYKNTNIEVKIPKLDNYKSNETEFRGVWVSAFAGDIKGYVTSKEACQEELTSVLDLMEKYNLNTILFHIRTHNDAFYNTNLAPKSNYIKACDFNKWDYLEWFINECHKRGIEFHAWMNPYRISSTKTTIQEVKSRFSSYPLNPASSANNVLIGDSGAILDPGSPLVRNYLINVCLEVMKKYDVDAIHFDDYFYIEGIDDSSTFEQYKDDFNTDDVEEFRRLQVDKFIEDLSSAMYDFNIANNRAVQLGISPSGVYRNGSYNTNYVYDDNGTLISPVASNSTGYSHYDSPLYSDTKKWIDNEWIDYIIPQLYGSFENIGMPYADMVDWWTQVVKYKKVNLYTGIGLYQMNGSSDKGWYTKNLNTFTNELLYNSKYEEVKGACIYSFSTLENNGYSSDDIKYVNQKMWNNKAYNPVSRRYNYDATEANVTLFKGNNSYTILIDNNDSINRYAIYRSINDIDTLIGFIGNNNEFDKTSYVDEIEINDNITYRIFPISKSNKKGNEQLIYSKDAKTNLDLSICKIPDLTYSGTVGGNNRITIKISKGSLLIGKEVSYSLLMSYDGKEYTEIKVFNKINGYRGIEYIYEFNDLLKPNYFMIEANNDYGTTRSEILKVDYNRIKASVFFEAQTKIFNNKFYEIINLEE